MILSASFSQRFDSGQRGTVLAGSSVSCSWTVGYVAFILLFRLPPVDPVRFGWLTGFDLRHDARTFHKSQFGFGLSALASPDSGTSSRRGHFHFASQSPYQTSFPQDAIHPAFRVVSERLEFAVEVRREHDAIREVLLEPFHFSLGFEIQTDIDFSCHAIEHIITPLRCKHYFQICFRAQKTGRANQAVQRIRVGALSLTVNPTPPRAHSDR